MDSAYNVIIRPVVSERSFDLMAQNKYTFEVAKGAAKEEIATPCRLRPSQSVFATQLVLPAPGRRPLSPSPRATPSKSTARHLQPSKLCDLAPLIRGVYIWCRIVWIRSVPW